MAHPEDENPPVSIPDSPADEGGRIPPRKGPRTIAFPLRLSPLERDEIQAAAQAERLTMADYMRRRILYYSLPSKRGVLDARSYAVLSQLHLVLRNLGNNLNQLAKAANSGFAPQANSVLELLQETLPPLDDLRALLVHVAGTVEGESSEWVEDEESDHDDGPEEAGSK